MSNKSPAFQWYPKDILASSRVQEMSLAEEGAYRRLLDYCWLNESVPADEKRCARIIGKGATPEMAKVVLEMFVPHPADETRMIHDRLEIEREKQKKNSIARKQASEARWNKRGKSKKAIGKQAKSKSDANALQMQSISFATPVTTIPFSSEKENSGGNANDKPPPTAANSPPKPPAESQPDYLLRKQLEFPHLDVQKVFADFSAKCRSGDYPRLKLTREQFDKWLETEHAPMEEEAAADGVYRNPLTGKAIGE